MRSVRVWIVSVVTLCLFSAACGSEDSATGPVPPYLTMLTEHASYRAGELVTLRLINHSEKSLSFYGCDMVLEVLFGSGWTRAEMAELPCIDKLLGVPARSERSVQILIPDRSPAGAYRVRFAHIGVAGTHPVSRAVVPDEQLATNVFAVR